VRASGVDVSSVLTGLAAVKQKTADDGAWLVEVSGSVEDGVASIAKALVSAGADIREIAPVQQDLEMVFRRVNEEVAA